MSVGYIFGGGTALVPFGRELYDRYESMRQLCEQVEHWTGLGVRDALTEDLTPYLNTEDVETQHKYRKLGTMRQAYFSIGLTDVLAARGIRPHVLAGSSLGGMISACVGGAISRPELFRLLDFLEEIPLAPVGEPLRGIAFAWIPHDSDLDWYCGPGRLDVHLAADYGDVREGNARMVLLSGYRTALQQLAAEAPEEQVVVLGVLYGGHSPLQQFVHDELKPYVERMEIRAPDIPVFSSLREARLISAEDVRQDILLNTVVTTRMQHAIAGLWSYGVEVAATIGQALPVSLFEFPFPNLEVATVDDIEQFTYSLYDLGIDLNAEKGHVQAFPHGAVR
ncbi:hypothetical protein KIPE111705_23190 [Kibdelosporangium persicum]|uniref:Malonyl-CoA:ACP transacylase (MAT) domain-containing protein n=1 Tax=Kibdelosporangium persicum TaxID=2698649 RepID=A0ABX2FJR1_9PSEU|nr:hypothetical protein [Kibdelosporangium persicum]NRN70965.1 hypothetical protein [Kibdelosporangium persicum]